MEPTSTQVLQNLAKFKDQNQGGFATIQQPALSTQAQDRATRRAERGAAVTSGMATQGKDFTVTTPSTVPSTAISSNIRPTDIQARRRQLEMDILSRMGTAQSNLASAQLPTARETEVSGQLEETRQLSRRAQLALNRELERLQTAPGLTQEVSSLWASDTARRAQRALTDLSLQESNLSGILQNEIAKRQQVIDANKAVMTADKETIGLLNDLQKITQPNLVGSPSVNQLTGDVTVFYQDPTTGVVTAQSVGNVGAQKSPYVETKWDGSTLYGMKADGTIEAVRPSGVGVAEIYVPGQDLVADAWIKQVQSGTAKITNVPANLRNKVVQGLGLQPGQIEAAEKLKNDARNIIDSLLSDQRRSAVKNATGPVSSRIMTVRGGTADVEADVARLRAILTKDNLAYMKGLGAMSIIEFQNIQNIADSLTLARSTTGFLGELGRLRENLPVQSEQKKITLYNPVTRETFDGSTLTAEELAEAKADGLIEQ